MATEIRRLSANLPWNVNAALYTPNPHNSLADNHYRLAEFTGKNEYREGADRILQAFSGLLARGASNYPMMLQLSRAQVRKLEKAQSRCHKLSTSILFLWICRTNESNSTAIS